MSGDLSGRRLESLYTESQDNLNPFLIGSRILGLHSVTNGNKDYIFTNCKDYSLEWTRELRVRQGTNGMREGTEKGFKNGPIKDYEKRSISVIFIPVCDSMRGVVLTLSIKGL